MYLEKNEPTFRRMFKNNYVMLPAHIARGQLAFVSSFLYFCLIVHWWVDFEKLNRLPWPRPTNRILIARN